jgi:tRNA nucleotidyltransferase (CCA-adding enzyme)
MANGQWEHFPHEADMGVRGFGRSKEEAFEQAAMALTAVISDPESIEAKEMVEIACEAPDDELLLVNWLNAVVYEMAIRKMLFGRFHVALDGTALRGQAWGEAIDVERHDPAVEVKGATCTGLKVAQDDAGRWFAQCVVDV